jgi:hypothetical protein
MLGHVHVCALSIVLFLYEEENVSEMDSIFFFRLAGNENIPPAGTLDTATLPSMRVVLPKRKEHMHLCNFHLKTKTGKISELSCFSCTVLGRRIKRK